MAAEAQLTRCEDILELENVIGCPGGGVLPKRSIQLERRFQGVVKGLAVGSGPTVFCG